MLNKITSICLYVDGIAVRRAVFTSLVVGLTLVAINQWELLQDGAINVAQALMTFVIPFLVSLVSTELARRERALEGSLLKAPSQPRLVDIAPVAEPHLVSIQTVGSDVQGQAELLVEKIRTNALNVNKASIERRTFIDDAMSFAEGFISRLRDDRSERERDCELLASAASDAQTVVCSVEENKDALNVARETGDVARQTSEHFRECFEQIRSMNNQIAMLAKKTNLLALNASIEAARSGDAGKAFAVVAGEVKDLSGVSSSFARQIDNQVTSLSEVSDSLLQQIDEMVSALDVADNRGEAARLGVKEVAEAMAETERRISSATKDARSQVQEFEMLLSNFGVLANDTEAAIDGSARNIELTDRVLAALACKNGSNQRKHKR